MEIKSILTKKWLKIGFGLKSMKNTEYGYVFYVLIIAKNHFSFKIQVNNLGTKDKSICADFMGLYCS